jgi:imidazoleglycerol-phosphate dehydratase/histidinol-phosphatase
MRKILLIDRDGTLIEEPASQQIDSIEEIKLVPGVIPALLRLKDWGYQFVMITNQDGLGTPTNPLESFNQVQNFLIDLLASQGIEFSSTLICPHLPSEGCPCRKPRLGLLVDLLKDRSIDWTRSAVIGDRTTDLDLAKEIGVTGYLLESGHGPWSWKSLATDLIAKPRTATVFRKTKETSIDLTINLDGTGEVSIQTGLRFFDHMLEQVGKHSGIDMDLKISGDLDIDDHHTIEDAGLVLGEAFCQAMSDKIGAGRYGFALPMDECRAEALLDFCGRSVVSMDMPFTVSKVGDLSTEMVPHFFKSWANAAGATLHISVSQGNQHHMVEASFKAFARALKQAVALSNPGTLQSTKGCL